MSSQMFGDRSLKKVNETHAILQDDTDYRSGTVINIRDPSPRQKPTSNWRSLVIILAFVVGTIFLYTFLVKSGLLKKAVIQTEGWLKLQWEVRPVLVMAFIYAVIQVLMVFCLGLKLVLFVITGLVIQRFAIAFPLLIFSSVSGDFLVFLICTYWLRQYFIRKFKDSDFFIVLLEESKSDPFTTAFVTRLMLIPNGLKNYVLMAIDNSPKSYFISGAVFHCIFTTQALLIAAEFREIEDFFSNEDSWEKKSRVQKFAFVGFLAFLIATIGLAIFLGVWTKRKIEMKKRAREEMNVRDYELS